jgi:glycerol-3-phosphate O-acyltransferase
MNQEEKYSHIRPYRDHEIRPVVERLLANPLIQQLISILFPDVPADAVKQQLRQLSTIFGFQTQIIYPAFKRLLQQTSAGFTYHGLENLDPGETHLYISNHIDISLDPMLIDFALYESGFDTMEIAIGDNLVGETWIRDLVRINKSFIVFRNLPPRELVSASRTLSEYILYALKDRRQSVWIAQREGRAKDGDHKTQPGILNMLAMAADNSLLEHYRQLNIVPVSISYELDPCGVDKVRSLYGERFLGGYKKKQGEDQLAMKKGILGKKGYIHLEFGTPLNHSLGQELASMSKQEMIRTLCQSIDKQIIGNYRLFKTNYIAADMQRNSAQYAGFYSSADSEAFKAEISNRIAQIDGEPEKLLELFVEKYAAPVLNYEALQNNLQRNEPNEAF